MQFLRLASEMSGAARILRRLDRCKKKKTCEGSSLKQHSYKRVCVFELATAERRRDALASELISGIPLVFFTSRQAYIVPRLAPR